MNYDYLGRDEQSSAGLFIRLIAPTDMDKLVKKIAELIADQYTWDWVNPTLTGRLGFDSTRVYEFVRDYMRTAKELHNYLTPETYPIFFDAMKKAYGNKYSDVDLADYVPALLSLSEVGDVPQSILVPYDYEATSILSDVGNVAIKGALPVGLLLALGIGAYAMFSGGFAKVPELFKGRGEPSLT